MCDGLVYWEMPGSLGWNRGSCKNERLRTDEQPGCAWVPVRRKETRESGDKVNASGVGFLCSQAVDLCRRTDHTHSVTKPLNGASGDGDYQTSENLEQKVRKRMDLLLPSNAYTGFAFGPAWYATYIKTCSTNSGNLGNPY